MRFLLLLFLAYTAGSINMSLGVSRLAGTPDPRNAYSRNPGAANVYRHAGPWWALLTVVLEAAKAAAVAWTAIQWLPAPQIPWVGFALILGNRFPVFHGFRGGKGVANYFGFVLLLNPLAVMAGIGCWAAGVYLTQQPFMGSLLMTSVLTAGVVLALGNSLSSLSGALLTCILIIGLHHENISGFLSDRKKLR